MARKKSKSAEQAPQVTSTEVTDAGAAAAYRKAVAKLSIPDVRKEPSKENALWFMRQGYVLVTVAGENGTVALEAAKKLAREPA